MLKVHNFNFYAGSSISAGDMLAIDATNSDSQHIAVATLGDGDHLIGFANRDAEAGEQVDFIPFEVGQVVHVSVSSATAGSQIGDAPVVALDSAASAGVIRAVCVALVPASDNA